MMNLTYAPGSALLCFQLHCTALHCSALHNTVLPVISKSRYQ